MAAAPAPASASWASDPVVRNPLQGGRSPPLTRGRSTTPRGSTSSNQTLVESGDAGPASASQTVTMGAGTVSILVIGGFT